MSELCMYLIKVKVKWICIVPSRETSKALRHGSHSFTCKQHRACLYLVSIHQMALPLTGDNVCLIVAYRPRKDERLSWPCWLTYSGRFTHISGYPPAVGRVQDRESSPVKDQRSVTAPLNRSSSRSFYGGFKVTLFCSG